MLTLKYAKKLARAWIAARSGQDPDGITILDDRTQCSRHGWLLFYAGGDAPVLVSHEGRAAGLGATLVSAGATASAPAFTRTGGTGAG